MKIKAWEVTLCDEHYEAFSAMLSSIPSTLLIVKPHCETQCFRLMQV